ncbi:MAG TPA: 2-dehydropantoate 2-reductase [Candidatus Paceibacterota bacterium]|nr:2-dehydropantoate 2-reductase [Verrucomicrobiota bacterium]HSA12825.1 2-dehydropantoate 2-reductase [Candidatus Paceibacterota bacterium]
MKVAVVGCGAVGSFYGAKLARVGHEVHFLLRSDFDAVRAGGLRIQSPDGDFQVQPRCARCPDEIGPADLVLIGLKTTANHQFPELLPPLVCPTTAVLTLQNGLGNEEQLARLFPVEQILGGLCFVCLNRIAPGLIRHIGYGQVVLGDFQRPPAPRTRDLATCFDMAGVACTVSDDLARAHWEKLVWNIPFNGLGVASAAGPDAFERLNLVPVPAARSCGCQSAHLDRETNQRRLTAAATECLTTDKLLGDAGWARLVRELMLEVISAARALGHDIPDAYADEHVERTRAMGAYKASTLIDFERGQALELESLFLEPLRQATRAGVPTPRLAALCAVLESL